MYMQQFDQLSTPKAVQHDPNSETQQDKQTKGENNNITKQCQQHK